jgi:hypothetical protein
MFQTIDEEHVASSRFMMVGGLYDVPTLTSAYM